MSTEATVEQTVKYVCTKCGHDVTTRLITLTVPEVEQVRLCAVCFIRWLKQQEIPSIENGLIDVKDMRFR
jgi:hypothetical protein